MSEPLDQLELAIREKNKTNLNNIVKDNTYSQLLQLREGYKTKYNRDLLADLKSKFDDDYLNTITGVFKTPVEYDAYILNKAMKGIGSNKNAITEIICFRDHERLEEVKKDYQQEYGKDLIAELKDETSGNYQKILMMIIEGKRNTNDQPDLQNCINIVEELFNEKGKFKKKELFHNYITTLSRDELLLVCKEYHKKYGKTMKKAIEDEFSGNEKDLLRALLLSLFSPCEYYAEQIMDSVKGLGTNDDKLIRIVVSRYNIDMKYIKKYFKRIYNKDLLTEVKDDVSGPYGELLEILINKQI